MPHIIAALEDDAVLVRFVAAEAAADTGDMRLLRPLKTRIERDHDAPPGLWSVAAEAADSLHRLEVWLSKRHGGG